MAFRDVYTFGPTFRSENSNTKTHASEFWMIEPEIAFCNLDELMDIEEDMLKYVVKYVMENAKEEIEFLRTKLKEKNVTFAYEHCANSAAIIDVKDANFDLVRAGISTYGLYPSEEVRKENVKLRPALELKSHVAFVKEIEKDTGISYGGTFVSKDKMKIATIPVGYADGYPRSLSNQGFVLIRGKKAPIVGRVCMDQFMVDVTHIEGVGFGDKVTLIGTDGNETISVEDLGELSGRFNYEFICDLGKRIPRVYVKNGKVSEQVDYFA